MEKNLIKFRDKRKKTEAGEVTERRKDLDSFRQALIKGDENGMNKLIQKYLNTPLITKEQLKIMDETKSFGHWKITEKSFYRTIHAQQVNATNRENILQTHPKEASLIHVITIECLKKETEEKVSSTAPKESAYLKFRIKQYEEYLKQARKQQELQEKREGQGREMSI